MLNPNHSPSNASCWWSALPCAYSCVVSCRALQCRVRQRIRVLPCTRKSSFILLGPLLVAHTSTGITESASTGHNGHKPDSATGHDPGQPFDVCDREPRSKGTGQTLSAWMWRLDKINTTKQEEEQAHVQERGTGAGAGAGTGAGRPLTVLDQSCTE